MNFQQNWANLVARKAHLDSFGKIEDGVRTAFPLTPSFNKWLQVNYQDIIVLLPEIVCLDKRIKTDDEHWKHIQGEIRFEDTLGKVNEPFSKRDIAAYSLLVREPERISGISTGVIHEIDKNNRVAKRVDEEQKGKKYSHIEQKETPAERTRLEALFPVSQQLKDFMLQATGQLQEMLEIIDHRIKANNPRIKEIDRAIEDSFFDRLVDEYNEYYVEPEIIYQNTYLEGHILGVDEYGDVVHKDFDNDGHFLPMGNPDNSTDYQDDFDAQDFQAEQWNSVDSIDDHHTDWYFREQCVTERPQFDEEGMIEWTTETHSDTSDPIEASDDMDFVRDARNWLTRENLMSNATDDAIKEQIAMAYPVSTEFLKYLAEKEIDFETANARLGLLIKGRDADQDDIKTVEDLPTPVEEDPMEEINREINALSNNELYQPPAYGELELDYFGTQFPIS